VVLVVVWTSSRLYIRSAKFEKLWTLQAVAAPGIDFGSLGIVVVKNTSTSSGFHGESQRALILSGKFDAVMG
jgi:hypothetical protein